jgi:hypothetical protein
MDILTVPLSDAEREAVRLYYKEGADLRTISALTGLSAAKVRAATDRAAALMVSRVLAVVERHQLPSGQPGPTPPRRRVVRLAQLPGAHTPPSTIELPLPELVAPADVRPAAAAPAGAVQAVPQPPDDGPGSLAWEALATSPTVRAWAIGDGWHIRPDAERVPGAIVLAYRNAHPGETL